MIVLPAFCPVARPAASIVAAVVLLLLQVPPPTVLPSAVVIPSHTFSAPLIAAGAAFTVTITVLVQEVGNV
jgi:hypothetical protein